MKRKYVIAATGGLLCILLGACSSDEKPHGAEEEEGTATASTCAPGSTLTYESFAKSFADEYCVRCHSSEKKDAERQGAPLGHDFDTEAGILAVAEHVDEYAAAGPDAVNTIMPPSEPTPSEDERRKLGEWLACNAPSP